MASRTIVDEFVGQATGRTHRHDAALPKTGGPAGNARLTAWLGLVLLVLFLAELVTILDVRSMIGWHVAIGVLLVPPAVLKTASTTWRFGRYYLGSRPYRAAGPPVLILRVLGPLVVASTLGVLGTGVALALVGPSVGREPLTSLVPEIDLLSLHKATFLAWAGCTGVHAVGRLIPALRLTVLRAAASPRVAGGLGRACLVGLVIAVGVSTAVLALSLASPWRDYRPFRDHGASHAVVRSGHY